jgi:cysteine desulfurase
VLGERAERLPNTSNVAFPGLDRQTLVMALDLEGLACSSGSACASGSSEPSAVHVAMGLPEAVRKGAVRFSFGPCHSFADADAAVDRILLVCKRLSRI